MNYLTRLFDTDGFPPRWHCGAAWQEDPIVGWVHIGSDLVTWMAYLLIPCALAYYARQREQLVFPRVFWLVGICIFACGCVHLLEAIIFFIPLYRLSAVLKVILAITSAFTLVGLFRIGPHAIDLPGLAEANERLMQQIFEREKVEQNLRQSNAELEEFTSKIINREDRMIELKAEVNDLLSELGRDHRYPPEPSTQ